MTRVSSVFSAMESKTSVSRYVSVSMFSLSSAVNSRLSRSGFTLIEIAVVIAIIGMVMMLVIPRLPHSDHENLKISARNLASTLRYVQDRAATNRKTYIIMIDPGTDKFRIKELLNGSLNEPDDPFLQRSPVAKGITIADVITARTGKAVEGEVRFDIGMGGLRDFVIIHLRGPDGNFWTVMAFPAGRKVKIYEGEIVGKLYRKIENARI